MHHFNLKNSITLLVFVCIYSTKIFSQEQKVTLIQDTRFEDLLNEKRNLNATLTASDRYKIQIFNGDSDSSKKALAEFKKGYKNYEATIVFFTPIYKVWVGSFKSRIEAERNLLDFKKKYPNAFIIKPNKE